MKSHRQNLAQRSLPATDRSGMKTSTSASASASASASLAEHTYCVVLHVVEAINFYGRDISSGEREQIIMNAALNTVDFEVEGTSSTTNETVIFNSNCIWECDMAGIKRIKTDHRPVKVTFFACSPKSNAERKTIGSLLLPVRGLPVLGSGGNNTAMQLKMFWHKLICISNEFRSHKPEVLLMLAIIKKSLLYSNEFKHLMSFNGPEKHSRTPPLQSPGHSITANMLQSQANVYVQSLVQLGLLQVGNDPLVDCDIIEVVLQFKELRNLNKFVKSINHGRDVDTVLLMFDFVGNVTNIDIKLNESDSYKLDDVLGMRFKSSLRSIRLYFQRIFYLPINMYINGTSIANYRMDFGKLLPVDSYFGDKRKYVCGGCFAFERFGRMGSARELKPIMEFNFSVDIQEVCWRQKERAPAPQINIQLPRQSSELDEIGLHSQHSSSALHVVPKELINQVQDLSDFDDADSLNVGAELSASDERDSDPDSHLSAAPDLDVSESASQSKGRHKKFIRLTDKKCAAKLHCDDRLDLSNDSNFEDELSALYSNSNLSHKTPDENSTQEIETKSKKLRKLSSARDSHSIESVGEGRAFKSARNETKVSENSAHFFDEEMPTKKTRGSPKQFRRKTISEMEFELLEKLAENSWSQDGQDDGSHLQRMPKQGLNSEMNSNPIEEMKPTAREKNVIKARISSLKTSLNESEIEYSLHQAETINVIEEPRRKSALDESLIVKHKIIHQKKNISKTEEAFEMSKISRKSTNLSKSISHNKIIPEEDSLPETELDIKKSKKRIVAEHSIDVDPAADAEEPEIFATKPRVKNNKSKLFIHKESEVCKTVITKNPEKMKKPALSRNDLTLSARWVAVNKEHAKMLQETDKFIAEKCKVQPSEISYEGHPIENPKKSTRSKLERPRKIAEANPNLGMESSIDDSFVVSKKKSIEHWLDQVYNLEMENPSLESFVNIQNSSELEESQIIYPDQKKSRQIKKKMSLEKYLNATDERLETSVDKAESIKNKSVSVAARSANLSQEIPMQTTKKVLKKKSSRAPSINQPEEESSNASQRVKKMKNCLGKCEQLGLDAQVSHLEVTVHMHDETARAKPLAIEMDDGLKQILAAGLQLQDDMQLKVLQYMRSLCETSVGNDAQTINKEHPTTGTAYQKRFKELEQHVADLENHLLQFERHAQQMQDENTLLAQEKAQLSKRISYMENEIAQLRRMGNGNDLKEVLSEMRIQTVRYQDMSKAKDRYKKQWQRSARRMHKLKLAMYEKTIQYQQALEPKCVLNLKSILTKDADEFEREYGRFRQSNTTVSVSASGDSEPLLKDYLRGLSSQTLDIQKPSDRIESTRMH